MQHRNCVLGGVLVYQYVAAVVTIIRLYDGVLCGRNIQLGRSGGGVGGKTAINRLAIGHTINWLAIGHLIGWLSGVQLIFWLSGNS
jgi:hypothetical protein